MAFNAYRGFDLVGIGIKPKLASLTANFLWEGPVVVADDITRVNNGIYCYKTIELLKEHASSVWLMCPVMAEIDIFGKVVYEYEFGYRAHKALIKRLWLRYTAMQFPMVRNSTVIHSIYAISHYSLKHGYAHVTMRTLKEVALKLEDRYQCPVTLLEATIPNLFGE